MKPTIKDIAKECDVSVATVSMALSDKPSRISPETRKRVRETAQRLHYMPNMAAVSLANRRSRLIGVVVNDIRNTHIASLFMAIDEELEKRGYSMICHVLDGDKRGSEELLEKITSESISALIWAKPLETDREEENRRLGEGMERLGIPVVTMDAYDFHCAGTNVVFDYETAALLATRHLLHCGHRRIGCLTGNPSFLVTQQRLDGYRAALEEFGLPFDETLVYCGNYDMASGYQALSYLLGQDVTAVFSFNDEMAFGLYQAARNYSVKIPDELSVIGCDDVPFADVMEVPLSTVQVPSVEMGRYIAEEICRLIESPEDMNAAESGVRTVKVYQPTLRLRGSVRRIG